MEPCWGTMGVSLHMAPRYQAKQNRWAARGTSEEKTEGRGGGYATDRVSPLPPVDSKPPENRT